MADRNADSDLGASADDDAMRHIFRFFDLPRELRDEVYDLSLADYAETLECHLEIAAIDIATANLLLVSKAFGHEYALRAKKKSKKSKMTISDQPTWQNYADLPPLTTRVSNVTINAVFATLSDANCHCDWISYFVKSAGFSSLSIRIHCRATHWLREEHEQCFADWPLERVSDLRVYVPTRDSWDFQAEAGGARYELSKITGKVEVVGDDQPSTTAG